MKAKLPIFFTLLLIIILVSCKQKKKDSEMNIVFLHHSTGEVIWRGGNSSSVARVVRRYSNRLAGVFEKKAAMPLLFKQYNKENDKAYIIQELAFPKASPYGWRNYPYDYFNIWVKNAGWKPFMEEATLEILTKDYQVIVFKHCFPVSNIQADIDSADIDSDLRTISNYKLQYSALRNKLHSFPDTKFILFTGAAQVHANIKEDEAIRAREFFEWVVKEWDLPGDNIYLWDLYGLQTEGSLYFRDEFALSPDNSHPSKDFAGRVVKLLFNRIIDIIESDGHELN